jgi:hypothetical protein
MVIESCPALVKYMLPVRLSRLHRRRRCFFCLSNSFAIVRRTGAYYGKEKHNRKPPAAFGQHHPAAERLRVQFPQEPATLLGSLHDETYA